MSAHDWDFIIWQRANDLLQQAERIHEEFSTSRRRGSLSGFNTGRTPSWEPPVNVVETDESLWVISALAGVAVDRVDVRLEGRDLVIAGERPLPKCCHDGELKLWEIPLGRFERRLRLVRQANKPLLVGEISFQDGLLIIELRKQCMNAEEDEKIRKTKPRLNIPAGALIIIPMRNRVLYPSMMMPLMVGRPARLPGCRGSGAPTSADRICRPTRSEYRRAAAQRPLRESAPPRMSCECLPYRTVGVRSSFKAAAALRSANLSRPIRVLIARVTMVEEQIPQTKEFEARILHLRQEAARALSLFPEPMNELRAMIERIEDPLSVIDMVASTLDLPTAEKQEILAILDPETRAQKGFGKVGAADRTAGAEQENRR